MPPGAAGEVYIGGTGLARGYAGRADLTAERFLPDPGAGAPGARLYRSGDLARHLPDGSLDYLGRNDHQVKIRGIRVEIGEVEAALALHPDVAQAAVIAVEAGEPRLAGFVVPRRGAAAPGEAALRRFLLQHLPEVMVPADLAAPLAALPVTANGKWDRPALLATSPPRRATQRGRRGRRRAPWGRATSSELKLVTIWEEVLERRPIGVRQGFSSTSAAIPCWRWRLLSRVDAALGIRLPLTLLFQQPTVEGMAAELRRRQTVRRSPRPLLVEIGRGGSRPPLVLVHAAGGDVFCYGALARELGPEQPLLALRARGLEDGESPLESVAAMAREYLAALGAVQPHGPYRLGGWSMGGMVAWEMTRQLEAAGEDVPAAGPPGQLARRRRAGGRCRRGRPAGELRRPPGAAGRGSGPRRRARSRRSRRSRQRGEARPAARSGSAGGPGLLPPDLGGAQVERLFRVFAAHARAHGAYRPAALRTPLAFFQPAAGGAGRGPTACYAPLAAGRPPRVRGRRRSFLAPARAATSEPWRARSPERLDGDRERRTMSWDSGIPQLLAFLGRRTPELPGSRARIVVVVVAGVASGLASAGFIALINAALSRGGSARQPWHGASWGLCLLLPASRLLPPAPC